MIVSLLSLDGKASFYGHDFIFSQNVRKIYSFKTDWCATEMKRHGAMTWCSERMWNIESRSKWRRRKLSWKVMKPSVHEGDAEACRYVMLDTSHTFGNEASSHFIESKTSWSIRRCPEHLSAVFQYVQRSSSSSWIFSLLRERCADMWHPYLLPNGSLI